MNINDLTPDYIDKHNMLEENMAKPIRDYYKQSGVNKTYELFAVLTSDDDTYISLARIKGWSPYSDRGRYSVASWHLPQVSPDMVRDGIEIKDTEIADPYDAIIKLIFDPKKPDTYDPDFYEAVINKNRQGIMDGLAWHEPSPYIILHNIDLDKLKDMVERYAHTA